MGDLLYIGSCSGNFYALDKDTGQVRWSYNIHQDGSQTSFHGDPLITPDLVIIGTDIGKQGHVYAFDPATGKVRWKHLVATSAAGDFGVATNIIRRGNRIYTVAQGDDLLCLDLANGQLRWHFTSKFDLTKSEWANSPAIAGRRVLFDGYDGFIYALDADSGKLIWKTYLHAPVTTTPIVIGDNIYAATSGHFYHLRAKDGANLGSVAFSGDPWRNVSLRGNELYLMSDLGAGEPEDLLAINMTTSSIKWHVEPPGATPHHEVGWATAWPYLWHDDVLASDKGHLYAYRQSDGSLAWSHDFPGQLVRGIGVTPNMLYVGTMHGMIYAFSPPQQR